jgi:hypothetical protein
MEARSCSKVQLEQATLQHDWTLTENRRELATPSIPENRGHGQSIKQVKYLIKELLFLWTLFIVKLFNLQQSLLS